MGYQGVVSETFEPKRDGKGKVVKDADGKRMKDKNKPVHDVSIIFTVTDNKSGKRSVALNGAEATIGRTILLGSGELFNVPQGDAQKLLDKVRNLKGKFYNLLLTAEGYAEAKRKFNLTADSFSPRVSAKKAQKVMETIEIEAA